MLARSWREGFKPVHPVIRGRAGSGISVFHIVGGMFVARPPPVMPSCRVDHSAIITIDKSGLRIRPPWPAEIYRCISGIAKQLTIQKNKTEGTDRKNTHLNSRHQF